MGDIKRYCLLKNIPEVKAGAEYTWDEKIGMYLATGWAHIALAVLSARIVENNPEFFKQIKEEKPKEEVFTWDDELVKDVVYWVGRGLISQERANEEVSRYKFLKTPSDKQSKQSSNTESKKAIKFSEEESNFIQATFNLTGNYYWTDFYFKKVGDRTYELWSVDKMPDDVIKLISPRMFTQADMDKVREDTWDAAREIAGIYGQPAFPISFPLPNKYPTFQDYKNSLKK